MMHGIVCVAQTVSIAVPELISSTWMSQIRGTIQNVNIS